MSALEKRRPAPNARPSVKPSTEAKVKAIAIVAAPAAAPIAKTVTPAPSAETFSPASLDFDSVASTAMFNTLGGIRALAVREASAAIVRRSIAEARGYSDAELYALAEIGYHYFQSGGLKLALVIFEGLMAVKPSEPYFCLATGLARDFVGDKLGAKRAYREAARLEPADARPELNLAEIALEAGDRQAAFGHLERARVKAERRGDLPLLKKANAVLALVR
jgi:tetratricopeptide (TPR) repeat protein